MMPILDSEGHTLFKQQLDRCASLLEYGAGGSTLLAAKNGIEMIFSVESDLRFLEKVSLEIDKLSTNSTFIPIHVNIGETISWGHPASYDRARDFPQYCVAPWLKIKEYQSDPDLVLIDGRFRVACFLASYILGKPGTVILFDDYVDRPQYHIVERFLPKIMTSGRLAMFRIENKLLTDLAVIMIMKYVCDPE